MARKRLGPEDYARMAELRERGLTTGQIAIQLGCSEGAVAWHCLRLGADTPPERRLPLGARGAMVQQRGGFVVRRFTAEEDEQLLALAAEGVRPYRIGLRLGRRHNSIVGRLMTLARRDARAEEAVGQ